MKNGKRISRSAAALAVGLSACGKSSKDAASKVMIVHQRY